MKLTMGIYSKLKWHCSDLQGSNKTKPSWLLWYGEKWAKYTYTKQAKSWLLYCGSSISKLPVPYPRLLWQHHSPVIAPVPCDHTSLRWEYTKFKWQLQVPLRTPVCSDSTCPQCECTKFQWQPQVPMRTPVPNDIVNPQNFNDNIRSPSQHASPLTAQGPSVDVLQIPVTASGHVANTSPQWHQQSPVWTCT